MPELRRENWNVDVARTLLYLSMRLRHERLGPLPAYVEEALGAIMDELACDIPGLGPAPRQSAADHLRERAARFFRIGRFRESLVCTISGLAVAPYDCRLWHQLGLLGWEFDESELALELIGFALWINPGHTDARSDQIGIKEFLERGTDDRRF